MYDNRELFSYKCKDEEKTDFNKYQKIFFLHKIFKYTIKYAIIRLKLAGSIYVFQFSKSDLFSLRESEL